MRDFPIRDCDKLCEDYLVNKRCFCSIIDALEDGYRLLLRWFVMVNWHWQAQSDNGDMRAKLNRALLTSTWHQIIPTNRELQLINILPPFAIILYQAPCRNSRRFHLPDTQSTIPPQWRWRFRLVCSLSSDQRPGRLALKFAWPYSVINTIKNG